MRSRSRRLHVTIVLWVVLAVLFAVLGVMRLATGDRPWWIGIGYLLAGVLWGVVAFLSWSKPRRAFQNPERA